MGSRIVPVRLDDGDLRQVDLLVRLGLFSSRSEALRALIRLGVRSLKDVAEVAEGLEKLSRLEAEERDIPIRLDGALRELLASRDRFT
ncbi:CopG family transcriptional regulator [Candidatus Bathyarchaeota archaeon]|nr:MAG: CopG family transcriptional regulator [Candidatus Bathyarchaeota archaeon]